MTLRLMEIIVPQQELEQTRQILDEKEGIIAIWTSFIEEETASIRLLLPMAKAEDVTDAISEQCEHLDGFRLFLSPVEATLPLIEVVEKEDDSQPPAADEEPSTPPLFSLELNRISREELYTDVSQGTTLTPTYVIMIVLATIVAAIGLLNNDVATIVGAMVIAPLLIPNIGLALGATLGDIGLIKRALFSGLVGLFLCFLLSSLIGFAFPIDPEIPALAARSRITFGNVLLALAAGTAGAMALTTGVSAGLIGVMVAVALLPPLVAAGLLAGAGNGRLALNALTLLLTNIIGVNLGGMLIFLLQGIRPRIWHEAQQAARSTRIALALWVVLLLMFSALIFWLRSEP